jgi:hypothetical protein
MTIRTQLKAGKLATNHNEGLRVRSAIKAGGLNLNHNEALRVRSTIKAGGVEGQHNETLRRASERHCEKPESATDIVWMRRQPVTTSRNEDRLTLLVVRAGLRAGRRARGRDRK